MTGVRRRILKPGDVVTVVHCHGSYRLPSGLPEHTRVTVHEVDRGYARVVDGAGRGFTVAFGNIDMPDDVWWQGQWIDRLTHAEGEKAFQFWIEHDRERFCTASRSMTDKGVMA